VNLGRLREIIDSYGACEKNWPSDERVAVLALLDESADARALVSAETAFDTLLDTFEVSDDLIAQDHLKRKILANVKQGLVGRIIEWLTPELESMPSSFWRPAVAATIPLILGIAIGINTVEDVSAVDDFSESETLYLLAISGENNGGWYDE